MKVTLLDCTGFHSSDPARRAAELMIFTKSTRLEMQPSLMDEIRSWSDEKVMAELEYMANTIPSSWEFVDYTFLIEQCTRAFTHQLVRSRQFSYAQQTMRVLNVTGWDYATGPTIAEVPALQTTYDRGMKEIDQTYRSLIKNGAAIEDARGVLPTNILTNITMKGNMRNFVELIRKRSSPRTQGEYREFLEQAAREIRKVHPWIDLFINRTADRAAKDLDVMIQRHVQDKLVATDMIKLVDQMRTQS